MDSKSEPKTPDSSSYLCNVCVCVSFSDHRTFATAFLQWWDVTKYHSTKCKRLCDRKLQTESKKLLVFLCVSVSGWTGQQQTVCLFHKGDQILAINDLHTSSVEEFNMYLSKSLKNEVNS